MLMSKGVRLGAVTPPEFLASEIRNAFLVIASFYRFQKRSTQICHDAPDFGL